MDTLAPSTLDGSLQALVDARLDTIDRMLMGMLPRADRLAIVREVENQIDELIAKQSTAPQTREDILEILARLDPPEAYLPEDGKTLSASVSLPLAGTSKEKPVASRGWCPGTIGGSIAIAGIVGVLPGTILPYLVGLSTESFLALFLALGGVVVFGLVFGSVGLGLSILGRNQGALAMVGLMLSPAIFFVTLLATIGYIAMAIIAS